MEILKQKKVRLENYVRDITTMNNPDYDSVIYLTSIKLSQYSMMDDNRREK